MLEFHGGSFPFVGIFYLRTREPSFQRYTSNALRSIYMTDPLLHRGPMIPPRLRDRETCLHRMNPIEIRERITQFLKCGVPLLNQGTVDPSSRFQ